VRLRPALARSINLVAIRVAEMAGIGRVVDMARALGIESDLEPSLALALGAGGVTPFELAGAYATIARGGMRWKPSIVTRILDPQGQEVPLPQPAPPARVVGPAEAYVVTSMLESVVTEGTAKEAMGLKAPCAGKTGTSNEAKDAWFAGFTPSLAAVAWVGFDDFKSLGKNETGAKAALPIWLGFMKKAVKPESAKRFAMPADGSVVVAAIDPLTGLLARPGQEDALSEVFLRGTEPTAVAPLPVEEGAEIAETVDAAPGETAAPSGGGAPDATASAPAPPVPASPRPRESPPSTPPPPAPPSAP
jgi:penicillin-binding protein 1A